VPAHFVVVTELIAEKHQERIDTSEHEELLQTYDIDEHLVQLIVKEPAKQFQTRPIRID
jgi:hypothetical protein